MLRFSQRCEYAIQALLELALRAGDRPVTIGDIAEAQGLPPKFLAAILAQLRQAGLVESLRGTQGGYRLARRPQAITVGQVVQLMDGPLAPPAVRAIDARSTPGETVLGEIRQQMRRAVAQVLDGTTFADLVEREARRSAALVANYSI